MKFHIEHLYWKSSVFYTSTSVISLSCSIWFSYTMFILQQPPPPVSVFLLLSIRQLLLSCWTLIVILLTTRRQNFRLCLRNMLLFNLLMTRYDPLIGRPEDITSLPSNVTILPFSLVNHSIMLTGIQYSKKSFNIGLR